MRLSAVIFLATTVIAVSAAFRRRSFRHTVRVADVPTNVEVKYYKGMKLDHFSYGDARTFDLRFMVNNTFYKDGGPIFFYTGNEGDLSGFVTATGIMFDIAPTFNAAIIFAEHRFYGLTQPFQGDSYSSTVNLGYLNSEQALADYAQLLTDLKTPQNQWNLTYPTSTPVISFGGSYGGMLSAWFRQKYPHIVKGAWAGSAPLIYFHDGGVDAGAFDNITSRTYVDAGCNRYILANSWNATIRLSSTAEGRAWLNSHFNFDSRTPIRNETDGWNLNYFFREAIEYMAMVDYPYPTSFLEPLPGWPVQAACAQMNATGTDFNDTQLVTMLGNAADIYYNYAQNTSYKYCIDQSVCGDQGVGGLGNDTLGWPWQACSEIVMPMCARGGDNDVFWSECGDNIYDVLADSCAAIFSTINWTRGNWDIDAVKKLYGLDLSGASNIILTQGHLDPWSGGGYKTADTSRGLFVLEIPASAHHLDLRTPNTCDPNTVTNARWQIIEIIKCWVNVDCTSPRQLQTLPGLQIPAANTVCQDINGGYPWGQKETASSSQPAILLAIFSVLTYYFF